MAKKKTKPTPKDDLIDSILNDVQELNDQDSKHKKNASADLFMDDYEDVESGDLMGFESNQENRLDETNIGAANLWQEIQDSSAQRNNSQSELVTPVYAGPSSGDSFEPYESSQLSATGVPEGFAPIEEKPAPAAGMRVSSADDKTINLNEMIKETPRVQVAEVSDADRTIAVEGFANRQPKQQAEVAPKVSFGSLRGPSQGSGSVYASADATLLQSESLKMAQQRILELEKEVEKYRQENDELASAGEIISRRSEEMTSRIFALEGEKQEVYDSLQNELLIVKGTLQYKESEVSRAKLKIEELESRLKSDFKKIRVRERELENRLELVKAEKSALLRAKDENILELKRKIDHVESELDNYRRKVLELNKTIDANQEQFKRTVRALRLALSNLEVKEENVVPLKKAD